MTNIPSLLGRIDARYGKYLQYFVLIPFLYPRGFITQYPLYKSFFTIWLFFSLLIVFCWVLYDLTKNGIKDNGLSIAVICYYLVFIIITLINQGKINDGLQKLFATPALYLFCTMCLRNDSKRFLDVLSNILLVLLLLNMTFLCPPVMDKIVGLYHINFLGHVQVGAQYGLIGAFTAFILLVLYPQHRIRAMVLLVSSIITVIWVQTLVGYIVLFVLLIGFTLLHIGYFKRDRRLQRKLQFDPVHLLIGYIMLSGLLLLYSLTHLDTALHSNMLALNGRTFVWRDGLWNFLKQPLLGYGAYGAKISTFWSKEMNYAHSELLQQLLDGGIVLCTLFYWMLSTFVRSFHRLKNKQLLAAGNIFLLAVLLIMLIESVTEYSYIALFFSLLAQMPEIYDASPVKSRRQEGNETQT